MRPKGDNIPILPVTDQSMEEEYQYPLMTVTSNVFSNRKYNLIETAQSNQSLKTRLFQFERQSNQQLYQQLQHKALQQQKEQIDEYSSQPQQIKLKTNVHEKLNAESKQLLHRRIRLQEEHLDQQLSQCSFHPNISNKSKQLGSQNQFDSYGSPRYMSPKHYIESQPQQQQTIFATHNKSVKLSIADKENVFERLQRPKTPIVPQVQSAKASIRSSPERVQAVTSRLYENAFQPRRIKSPQNLIEEMQPKCSSPDPNKEKCLVQKFVKEFYKAITKGRMWTLDNLEKINSCFNFDINQDLCLLTLDELAIALDTLGYIPYSTYDPKDKDCQIYQLYRNLQCPDDFDLILSRNLLTFLLAMKGFNVDYSLVPKYSNNYQIEFPKKLVKELFKFEQGNLVIESKEVMQEIQKQYHLFQLNYLAYKKGEQLQPEPPQYFKTSNQTNKLAKKYRSRVQSQYAVNTNKIELNDFNQIYQLKKEKLQQEQDNLVQASCPFKPITNQTKASPKYMYSKRQEYSKQEEDLPSFTPQLYSNRNMVEIQPNCKEGAIQRIIKGRINKELKELILLQGTCNEKKRKQIEEKIQFNSNYPILHLDIELDDQVRRLVIYKGDTAEALANKFIKQYKLNQYLNEQLRDIIQEQLDTL